MAREREPARRGWTSAEGGTNPLSERPSFSSSLSTSTPFPLISRLVPSARRTDEVGAGR